MSIPRRIRRRVPNLVPISPVVWQFPQTFEFVTPLKPPGVLRGELYLAYVHSKTNQQICTKFGANRSCRFTTSPNIWICDSLKKPKCPWSIVGGELYLAYVHSQTNPPMCTQFGANRCNRLTASQDFWICDPLPPKCSLGYCGATWI